MSLENNCFSYEESYENKDLENQELIDIKKENYYQELYSMDIFRFIEHSGYKDLMEIPETDYKYLGVNKQILLQLQEWNNWFEIYLEDENNAPKEPIFPTLLPRVKYVKKQLVQPKKKDYFYDFSYNLDFYDLFISSKIRSKNIT